MDSVEKVNKVLDDIASLTTVKDVKTIVFVNRLDAFLLAHNHDYKYIGRERNANGVSYNFCAITDSFEFRNTDPLLGERVVKTCDEVFKYLKSYGVPLYKVKWSMAHMAQKQFYDRELRESLWRDTKKNKRYFHDISTYNDMFAGSSSGHLWCDDNYKGIILENVSSFDKKSAYPWVFCTNNHFPLTAPTKTNFNGICDAVDKDKWFLIVLRGIDLPNQWDMFRAKGDDHCYAWNLYDYYTCCITNKDLFGDIVSKYDCQFYTASKCGYLNREWREKVSELYQYKDEFEDKDDPDRVAIKTQLDMMYGKGIQYYEFDDIDNVIGHYSHRGDHYIMPQWSKMAVSAIKYEIIKTYLDDSGQFYADTDGTKSLSNRIDLQNLYHEYNLRIAEINKKAGLKYSTMGTWQYEYTADRFIALNRKQYAYEIDTYVTTKVAGVKKDLLIGQLAQYDDPLQALADGVTINRQSGLIYLSDTKEYIPKFEDYVVGQNYMEG